MHATNRPSFQFWKALVTILKTMYIDMKIRDKQKGDEVFSMTFSIKRFPRQTPGRSLLLVGPRERMSEQRQ